MHSVNTAVYIHTLHYTNVKKYSKKKTIKCSGKRNRSNGSKVGLSTVVIQTVYTHVPYRYTVLQIMH